MIFQAPYLLLVCSSNFICLYSLIYEGGKASAGEFRRFSAHGASSGLEHQRVGRRENLAPRLRQGIHV